MGHRIRAGCKLIVAKTRSLLTVQMHRKGCYRIAREWDFYATLDGTPPMSAHCAWRHRIQAIDASSSAAYGHDQTQGTNSYRTIGRFVTSRSVYPVEYPLISGHGLHNRVCGLKFTYTVLACTFQALYLI